MRKNAKSVTILCTFTYFISYITRINYASLIHEIRMDIGDLASLALSAIAIAYGAGQLLSGYMGDRIKPEKLIFYALLTTVAMNVILPIFPNPWFFTVVWCINGIAQAFIWPPLVKYMTGLMSDDEYKSGCVTVSWGASFGTIFVYLLSPVCVRFLSWEYVFYITGAMGIVMAFLWKHFSERLAKEEYKEVELKKEEKTQKLCWNFGLVILFAGIMTAIALQGMLRDGIQDWMPTYIDETYNLGSAISILTGVLLPIFSIISLKVASLIYTKWLKIETVCAGAIAAVAAIAAFILCGMFEKNAVVSIILTALIAASMHGVNLSLIGMIPPKFRKYGKVSFMTGLLNSCTYVGAAIAGYGMPIFADAFGWNVTIFMWGVIAMLDVTLCAVLTRPWKKFMQR